MKNDDLLKEIRDRFKESYDAVNAQYERCIEDLRFHDGEQWPVDLKASREADQRPCLTINKVPAFCNRVINDIRQNEPSIKVKPVDSKADPQTAEILTGLIKNIEVTSDAEIAYDTAIESAVRSGIGAFRITTEYAEEAQFDQDIKIRRIKNPFTIYWDPGAQAWDKSDAKWCFVTEKIRKEEFESQYPGKVAMDAEGGKDSNQYWDYGKYIRIVEYYKVTVEKKKLYLVQDDKGNRYTTDMKPEDEKIASFGWKILQEREIPTPKITWYKASQGSILEGPNEWAGKYIPIVMVYGEELNVENETKYSGLIKNSKDPQRLYNYSRSTSAETISLAPKVPYLVTAKMIAPYQQMWEQAHKKSLPFLPFDVDPSAPTLAPQRVAPISMNTGIKDEILAADQEMHDCTGLQLASLGKKSNEQSGVAIAARAKEGDVGSFHYYDNLCRAIKYEAKVILDLIPHIYDTERIIRIVNPDGTDKQVVINKQFNDQGPNGEDIQRIYDLSVGKYDVVATVGPSFMTQRDESAAMMVEFMKVLPPQANMLIADLLVDNMDWPKAKQISERLKALLPPQLQAQQGGGAPPIAAPPPNPMQQMAINMQMRRSAAEIQGKEIENETAFEKLQRIKAGLPEDPQMPKEEKPDKKKE